MTSGWFEFAIETGSVEVVIGLVSENKSTRPSEPTHAFRVRGSVVQIVEGPSFTKFMGMPANAPGTRLYIARAGSEVIYGLVDSRVWVDGVHFELPGPVIYRSKRASEGPIHLDAALRAPGDSVVDAVIYNRTQSEEGSAFIKAAPPQVWASETDSAGVLVRLEEPLLTANQGSAVYILARPGRVFALDTDASRVALSFPSPTVRAEEGYALDGVSVVSQAPRVFALDEEHAGAEVKMVPLQLLAAETDVALAYVKAGRPLVFARGNSSFDGASFEAVLPPLFAELQWLPEIEEGDIEDVAWADEELYPSHYFFLDDVAVGDDQLSGGRTSSRDVEDNAQGLDEVLWGANVDLTDEGVALDEASVLVVLAGALIDEGVGDDETIRSSVATVDVLDDAAAVDEALPYSVFDAQEEGVGDDALWPGVVVDVIDEALAEEELDASGFSVLDSVEDVAVGEDEVIFTAELVVDVEDAGFGEDALFFRDSGALAWVLNTETGATYWYDNYAFEDMVTVGDKTFASGPQGLVLLGGDTDAGDEIKARVLYGFQEFGDTDDRRLAPQQKRISGLMVGYDAEGILEVLVQTYGDGQPDFRYQMPPREADRPRNNRVRFGRGLRSRYWGLGIENIEGCDFEVHSLDLDIVTSKRRL